MPSIKELCSSTKELCMELRSTLSRRAAPALLAPPRRRCPHCRYPRLLLLLPPLLSLPLQLLLPPRLQPALLAARHPPHAALPPALPLHHHLPLPLPPPPLASISGS